MKKFKKVTLIIDGVEITVGDAEVGLRGVGYTDSPSDIVIRSPSIALLLRSELE